MTAIVELTCQPSARAELLATLVDDGRLVSIEESSRGGDFVLTVMVPDTGALTTLVLDELPLRPGVQTVRPSVVVKILYTGSDWRVGVLSDRQKAEAQRVTPADGGGPMGPRDLAPLLDALTPDPRASLADLARDTGLTPATVRGRMHSLLAGDRVVLRCDVAHADFGLPVTSAYFARVAPADIPRTVAGLVSLPTLRMCLQITGEHNLIFSLLSPSVAGVAAVQAALGKHLPWVQITESRLILRTPKRMGWVLDPDGRPTGRVVAPTVLAAAD